MKAKDKRRVPLPQIHRPHDEVTSEVTQNDLSIATPTHAENVTAGQTNIRNTDELDPSANGHLRTM